MDGLKIERHQIERLRSVAHLFPRTKGRQGVYALDFANGERYVGQAVNVVARLATHSRRWADIVAIEFGRVGQQMDLDAAEQRWIQYESTHGRTLRNIRYALGPADTEVDLDLEVSHPDQLAWLNDDAWLPDVSTRVESEGQRAKTDARYQALRRSPLVDQVVRGLKVYIDQCIPRPRATELTFWAVSATPSTNKATWPRLAAVSINSMETLVLGHQLGKPDTPWGFLNVSAVRAGLPTNSRRLLRSHPGLDLSNGDYEAAGPDQIRIGFNTVDQLISLLADREIGVRDAARDLNLRVMRKGPTMQWRAHCPALPDQLL